MKRYFLLLVCVCFVWGDVSAKETAELHNAVKTTFLSWFTGSCKISYERSFMRNQTMEATVGYIGFGADLFDNHPKGWTVRYGHKYMFFGNKTQPLNGFYIRPEVIYSRFHYDTKEFKERKLSNMGSALLTIGYQYIQRRFVVDAFWGSGYAIGNEADTNYQHGFALWDYFGSYNKHIAMTFGIKLGFCF